MREVLARLDENRKSPPTTGPGKKFARNRLADETTGQLLACGTTTYRPSQPGQRIQHARSGQLARLRSNPVEARRR